jgi:hypothetical protein
MQEIYLSQKYMHRNEDNIILLLKDYSFNIYRYKSNVKGTIEEGFKIEFTQEMNIRDYRFIYNSFLDLGYIDNCFYLKTEGFEGCIKKYLKED